MHRGLTRPIRTTLLRTVTVALVVASVASGLGAPAGAEPAQRTEAGVMRHAQSGGGPVAGASADLVATDAGVSVNLRTVDLVPGHAYTLWFVMINNPEECLNDPCTASDIFRNENVHAQVAHGAGHVAGESGRGGFAVRKEVGPIEGWLPNRVFDNPLGAEIHVVLNDHGPALPEHMPGMIHTYRGGCSDDSPFPAIFPPAALEDGEVGPNICRLFQVAVFQQ